MKKLIIAALLTASCTVALADSVVVTETKSWKSVPITVDTNGNVYSVEGTLPTDGDYYYSYSGYRCFSAKRSNIEVEPTIYRAKVAGGSDIYCYPE
jgi:hypothetical protein